MKGRTERVRLTVLAEEVGIHFYDLFCELCRLFPQTIDDDLTVPAGVARFIRESAKKAA